MIFEPGINQEMLDFYVKNYNEQDAVKYIEVTGRKCALSKFVKCWCTHNEKYVL